MTLEGALFTMIAAMIAVSALAVVLSRNIVRCAVWLLFTLAGTSLLYFLIGAEFLGAAQLIVYVGGTMVLVIFGVMLTAQAPFLQLQTKKAEWVVAGLLCGGLFALLVYASLDLARSVPEPREVVELPGVTPIGEGFLGVSEGQSHGYLLPFEIVSVHLLVVLIGAAYLARAKRRRQPDGPAPVEGASES